MERWATSAARRRTLFKAGGAVGVLLAAGVPALAFAENGQGIGVGQQKGKLRNICLFMADTAPVVRRLRH